MFLDRVLSMVVFMGVVLITITMIFEEIVSVWVFEHGLRCSEFMIHQPLNFQP